MLDWLDLLVVVFGIANVRFAVVGLVFVFMWAILKGKSSSLSQVLVIVI